MPTTEATPTERWWAQSLCREIGSEIFFVGKGEFTGDARRACQLCPVQAECLADALESEVLYGVYGGLSREQRKPLIKQVRRGARPFDVAVAAVRRMTQKKAS